MKLNINHPDAKSATVKLRYDGGRRTIVTVETTQSLLSRDNSTIERAQGLYEAVVGQLEAIGITNDFEVELVER